MNFKYLVIFLSFAACGENNQQSNTENSTPIEERGITNPQNDEEHEGQSIFTSENLGDYFAECTQFPYDTDSELPCESKSFDLNPEHLNQLYLDVKKFENKEHENTIKCFITIDSLRRKDVSEDEIMKDYWQFQEIKIQALHKLKLTSGIEIYIWRYEHHDGNQGPEVTMATILKDGKPYSCFQLGTNDSYSDSPIWTSTMISGKIFENGKVIQNSEHEDGEYAEDGSDGWRELSSIRTELLITESGDLETISSKLLEYKAIGNDTEKPDYKNYNAITVGNGLKLRSKTNLNSEIIKKYNTGELIKTLSKSEQREKLSKGNTCDKYGYYWYQVYDTKGNGGFLNGKYIYEIGKPAYNDKVFDKTYKLGDKNYKFAYAEDLGYGPSDSTGLTGCNKFYLPFFYDEGNKIMPIYYDKEKFPAKDLDWKSELFDGEIMFLVSDSEGGSDHIEQVNPTIYQGVPSFKIVITHAYQNGSSKSKIYVAKKKNMEVIGYEHEGIGH